MKRPSASTIVWRSLAYFLRSHLSVALGIAAATAVVVGALAVGDSVRASLRSIVLSRLSSVECLLHSRTFFEPEILDGLLQDEPNLNVVPAILLSNSTVEHRTDAGMFRASKVQLIAGDDPLWKNLAGSTSRASAFVLEEDQVALNEALAQELGVVIGDEITVRMGATPGVPADNPLGRRDDVAVSLPRQQVVAIVADAGFGGLSFVAGQEAPRNVFCSRFTVQDILECGTTVNAALVLSDKPSDEVSETGQLICDELNLTLRPSLEDFGLQLTRHTRIFPDEEIDQLTPTSRQPPTLVYDYFQLSSDELVLNNATTKAVVQRLGLPTATRLITYVANGIKKTTPDASDTRESRSAARWESRYRDRDWPPEGRRRERSNGVIGEEHQLMGPGAFPLAQPETEKDIAESSPAGREVPYSIVVGVDKSLELNLASYTQVEYSDLRMPYCWVNSWLAKELSLEPGDWVQMKYFEPETVDGQEVEKETNFMVAGIVPLTTPAIPFRRRAPAQYSLPPTVFNDPSLTPTVPGITDQDSISKWDVPFDLDEDLILDSDDKYWENHRLTPKVFTPYNYSSSLQVFGSRFGQTTAIRIQAELATSEEQLRADIEESLLATRSQNGLVFHPIRSQQLAAASGTTPFDALFLSLSFFVIVAALLLVTLLLKLSIEKRASQLGLLYAQGYAPSRVVSLLLREHVLVAIVGAAVGVVLGIGYAAAMIAGLESWWIGAISTQFLDFSFRPQSLIIGFVGGLIASGLTIFFGLRRLSRIAPLPLLRGQTQPSQNHRRKLNRVQLAIAGFSAIGACGLMISGFGQSGMARAGIFFGSGVLVLTAILLTLHQWIENGVHYDHSLGMKNGNLFILAWRAISRNPVRSSLALGLLSVASFLIASMGVFQISPTELGYGNFDLIGESSQPIYLNLASAAAREEALGEPAKRLLKTTVVPMRQRQGEDASCNNLFQVSEPTILGVTTRLENLTDLAKDANAFPWSAASAPENPWTALNEPATGSADSPIPVILDQNTAMWSLKQGKSLDSIIQLEYQNRRLHFRTVGLLNNSVLQGKLLIGERNFESLFPEISGYSFFLIRSGNPQDPTDIVQVFEDGWSDEGLDVKSSEEILEKLLGVQNTYISAFQSLGALGLLLGSFGLIAVQLRSVVERRKELALMQAVGFSQNRIARMLTLETAILLLTGLMAGVLAATISLAPFVIETGPTLSLLGPLSLLAGVLAIGFMVAIVAVRAATKRTVLQGLRGE